MKKLFLMLCGIALFSLTAPAKASPVKQTAQTQVTDVGKIFAACFTTSADVSFEKIETATRAISAQVEIPGNSVSNVPTYFVYESLAPESRFYLYRHYFKHEDNKRYDSYKTDELSKGFSKVPYRPKMPS